MRISGWALAGAWVVLAGGVVAAPAAAWKSSGLISGPGVEAPAQAAPRRTPIVDGFDIGGQRLRLTVGQPITIRIWSHVQREHAYRLLPTEGVEQVGRLVLYTAPPSDGVGFTNAYDLTLKTTREGVFPISIVSAHNQTGVRNDISASPVHFELQGVGGEVVPHNRCEPPRYLNHVGDCVSPPPRN